MNIQRSLWSEQSINKNAFQKHWLMAKTHSNIFNEYSDALSNGVGQQGHTVFFFAKNAHSDALLNKVDQRDPKCENRRDMPVSALPFFPLSQWQSVSSCDGGAVTVSSISSGTTVSLAKGIGLP